MDDRRSTLPDPYIYQEAFSPQKILFNSYGPHIPRIDALNCIGAASDDARRHNPGQSMFIDYKRTL